MSDAPELPEVAEAAPAPEPAQPSPDIPATSWSKIPVSLRKTVAAPVSPTMAESEAMPHYSALSANLRRFAELVAGGETGSNAARILRPRARCPRSLAWRLRSAPHVKEAIVELQEHVRAAFLGRELRHKQGIYNRANADRTPLAVPEFWETDPRDWPLELKDCIESVEFKDGKISKVTLSNRNDASRLFSQHMGWLVDRKELTGKDGAPLLPKTAAELSDEQLALLASELSEVTGTPETADDTQG